MLSATKIQSASNVKILVVEHGRFLNFDFEGHLNTLISFDKKGYGVRFEYVPWKNVHVVSIDPDVPP